MFTRIDVLYQSCNMYTSLYGIYIFFSLKAVAKAGRTSPLNVLVQVNTSDEDCTSSQCSRYWFLSFTNESSTRKRPSTCTSQCVYGNYLCDVIGCDCFWMLICSYLNRIYFFTYFLTFYYIHEFWLIEWFIDGFL